MDLDIVTKVKNSIKKIIYSRILWIIILNIILIIIPIYGLYLIRSKDYKEVYLRSMAAVDLNRSIAYSSNLGVTPDILGQLPAVAPYQRIIIVDADALSTIYDTNWLINNSLLTFRYDLFLTRLVSDFIGNPSYPNLKRDEIINRMTKYIKPGNKKLSIINYRFVYSIRSFTLEDNSKYSSIVIIDKSDIVKNTKIYKILLLIITFFSALFSVIVSSIYYKLIIKPLTILTKETELIKDLDRIPATIFSMKNRGDEIGLLSKAFYSSSVELTKRREALEGFTRDVLHELKNPLTGIRNSIELLKICNNNSDDMLSIISRESARIEKLLFDIREYSLFDKANNSSQRCNPVEVIKNILSLYHQAEIKEVLEDNKSTISMSEDQLVSVLTNLIDNAIDFSPEKGSITISYYSKDNKYYLKVDDLGPGIPNLEKSKIFNRFYTNRQSNQSISLHSGLGLSIIKNILEKNNHTIICKDNIPAGTSFIITFNS